MSRPHEHTTGISPHGWPQAGQAVKDRTSCTDSTHDRDAAHALSDVFDRVTGKAIRPEQLKTYEEVLVQYHLSCEEKFENGQYLNRGRTERRHVVATGFVWIGKEANRVGDSGQADPIWSAVEEFAAT